MNWKPLSSFVPPRASLRALALVSSLSLALASGCSGDPTDVRDGTGGSFAAGGSNGSGASPGVGGSGAGGSGGAGSGAASSGGADGSGAASSGGMGGEALGGMGGDGEPEDDRFFGTAPGSAADYADVLEYFGQITPENAGKWGVAEPTRDVMVWTDLDTAYQFAKANNLLFKFHTLIWGQQQPSWLAALSAEEQLAEIEEWMDAVAERYPDLELIDVVNEPMHAKPAYRAALGGEGTTGWDWVIKSFELARERYPDAQLILNDYNILMLEQFTTDYLAIIQILKDRDLIDGIGLQAHFLERAELDVVESNLDRLAATGLPIYISELDVNFANDARQATRLSELFTMFWEHPSVAGITYWGHLEGQVWQPYTHLIESDGTLRPSMEWIQCYLGGGSVCPLPPYVPDGWQGGQYGVTLEAELYDEGAGLVALGNSVAYTDQGDWIAFYDVDLDAAWDTLWVTYAKGASAAGSLAVYVDEPEGTPALTVELPQTGGWSVAGTAEAAWPALDGLHDVYFVFQGTTGIANVDSLRIGTPPPASTNLITNSGFEEGLTGWSAGWATGVTLAASTDFAFAGNQSLKLTNFTTSGAFARYTLTSVVTASTSYDVSAQLRLATAGIGRISAKIACSGVADQYTWIKNDEAVPAETWTALTGTLTLPACDTFTEVLLYFEGTASPNTIYVDEVSVTPKVN